MTDWEAFKDDVTWFPSAKARVGETVESGGSVPMPSDEFTALFPTLRDLLAAARLTPVTVKKKEYHLLAWEGASGMPIGWLCDAPSVSVPHGLFREHVLLLGVFGGIGVCFNEPEDTWLLNLNAALTLDIAKSPEWIATEWIATWGPFREGNQHLPLDMKDFYTIALEANGNETLCHRTTGDVLLFAHDHSFDHVVPLENCPDYTFYRIPSAPRFRDWVERVASQWSRHIRR